MIIQNDRELMLKYLRSVEDKGLDSTNQIIGKEVKEAYKLKNLDDRENNPASCTLIQSYQKFEQQFVVLAQKITKYINFIEVVILPVTGEDP